MKTSVALCTYNGEQYIEEQLLSIIEQTHPVDEIVICDDGSNDETLHLVEQIKQKNTTIIRIYQNQPGLGVCENFKKAASLCTGDIIFFADQDDVWRTDKVETIIVFFSNQPDTSVVFTDALLIDSDSIHHDYYGTLFGMTFHQQERRMFNAGLYLESFLNRNHATGATMAVRKEFLDHHAPFDLCMGNILHDYAIALKAAEVGELAVLSLPLIEYRRHNTQQTGFDLPQKEDPSIWYHYYDHLRELWPSGEVTPILKHFTANHAQERIKYINTRNRNLHRLTAPFLIPLSLPTYRRMYGHKWHRVMRYDISQCIRYTFLRLTHRLPEQ